MSLQDYKDIHKGQTAFICGSGCSLREIKESKLNGVIFAVNLAILKFNKPDYVVMCDGSSSSHDWYAAAERKAKIIFKVGEGVVNKRGQKNEVFIERESKDVLSRNDKKLMISDTLPTAVHLAYVMGFEKIILLGNDLSYSKEGYKYYTQYAGIEPHTINGHNDHGRGVDDFLNITKNNFKVLVRTNPDLPLYTVTKADDGITKIDNEWD